MKTLVPGLLALALAGCATPQVVLDQASNGAGLAAGLSGSLDDYTQAVRTLADQRRNALLRAHDRAVSYRLLEAETEQTYLLSGQAPLVELYRRMKGSADVIAKVRDDGAADLRRYAQELDAIGKPLPDVSAQLQAVQGNFAQLAEKPSAAERLRALKSAWHDAKSPTAAASAASSPD